MNQCYTCKHRMDVVGSAHSQCAAGLKAIMAGSTDPMPNVVGADRGIICGWFFYPFNYDPVWLDSCDSHVKIEGV